MVKIPKHVQYTEEQDWALLEDIRQRLAGDDLDGYAAAMPEHNASRRVKRDYAASVRAAVWAEEEARPKRRKGGE